ncbi:MAG: isocitrate lyase/phosphoenolpyruvate mutase family protein, partial [Acetobacteraceae bacterium]|nr:isocitrate lyase/phosphoenolpyruvate mutase family protein [Acetobacteraceae bacterium]
DIGLVSLTEVADVLSCVTERVGLPVIVDADTGFGNALNVQRTVRVLERARAAAIQLEDQGFPKRCGHLRGKSLVSAAEMVGKIRAALDARTDALIIARTDAIAVEGFEPALERAERYRQAGADILFIEAPESLEQMQQIPARFPGVALLANMVEGGRTPINSADELGAMGYRIVIFPGGTVRALTRGVQDYLAVLKQDGTTGRFRERMHDFNGMNAVIGTPGVLERGKRYDAEAQG